MDKKNDYKDKVKVEPSADWLSSLTVIGRILISVPFIGLPVILYSLISGQNTDSGCSEGSACAAGLLFLSGLITLIYVAIKRFQENLRNRKGDDDDDKAD
ncbi:MAG: hypothetical protein R6U37_08725 [Dehalococcoidia bacterium]